MNVEVNFIAVFLAAVASMVIGFIWYSPMLLGKPWMAEKGYTPETLKAEQAKMMKYYGVSFILALITAYVLAHVAGLSKAFFNQDDLTIGLQSGFWMWLGFVMTVQATDEIFGSKKWKLFGINTGYQLVTLLVMGAIIAWFGIS